MSIDVSFFDRKIGETIMSNQTKQSICPASNMIRGATVPAADTLTFAESVGVDIPSSNVGPKWVKHQKINPGGKGCFPLSIVRDRVCRDREGKINQGGAKLDQSRVIEGNLPTPVRVDKLAELLTGYPKDKFEYIIDGFTNGFRIGYSGDHCPQSCGNLRSAKQHPEIVRAIVSLGKEVKSDLQMWHDFALQFQGKSMFLSDGFLSNDALHLHTDAAKSSGFWGNLRHFMEVWNFSPRMAGFQYHLLRTVPYCAGGACLGSSMEKPFHNISHRQSGSCIYFKHAYIARCQHHVYG